MFGICRAGKLEDSLAFQQFSASLDEEESWIHEKQALVSSEDVGDSLAAVQVKKMNRRRSAMMMIMTTIIVIFYDIRVW